MNILVVNDDGITASGIIRLSRMACRLGRVWVVAPDSQCSAMSQKLTINSTISVRPAEFPVDAVEGAWSVSGTPADCVKLALTKLLPVRPDIVFSGINLGYNSGYDIVYSGTVGAAMEALMSGIPAMAFSTDFTGVYDVVDEYLESTTREVLSKPISGSEIWNINFPGIPLNELKGTLYDRVPAACAFYENSYTPVETGEDGSETFKITGMPFGHSPKGTDVEAILNGYISIGTIRNMIL